MLILSLITCCLFGCGNKEEEEWLKQVAAYREAKFNTYADENEKYSDYEVDVAFLGDSLTDGYNLSEYYPEYLTANRGIGGETTTGLLERMPLSVYELKPKVAVMLIGINNVQTMFDDYEQLLIGLTENLPNTQVIILSLTSMSGSWGERNQIAAYNNVKIKMLAEKYGFQYVDLYSPLMDLESGGIYPEYTTDGGHLTPKGYWVLTEEIKPAIESALQTWEQENRG